MTISGKSVKSKFGLSDAAELQIFDETDTAVEEDILLELMEANPDLCLTVCDSFLGEGWDSDMASLLLLLYLLSSTAGRKRTKISRSDAVDKMVHLHKSCCSIDEHLRGRKGQQPYILAAGRTRNRIDTFYIVIDKRLIPFQATSSLGSFDELFKSHYVFNLSYEESLVQLYTFVQTTVYNIDINITDESPRIRELRAKLLK
ncbi:hypothetical protein NQZ68_036356 [Dissostichus eleginoides]|nr:hypothetical protein NQZ68_036356 [Dissostichus eleginoides]